MRPMVKPLQIRQDGDVLRLVREPGVYFELPDETGRIRALLAALTGERTVEQVHQALVAGRYVHGWVAKDQQAVALASAQCSCCGCGSCQSTPDSSSIAVSS